MVRVGHREVGNSCGACSTEGPAVWTSTLCKYTTADRGKIRPNTSNKEIRLWLKWTYFCRVCETEFFNWMFCKTRVFQLYVFIFYWVLTLCEIELFNGMLLLLVSTNIYWDSLFFLTISHNVILILFSSAWSLWFWISSRPIWCWQAFHSFLFTSTFLFISIYIEFIYFDCFKLSLFPSQFCSTLLRLPHIFNKLFSGYHAFCPVL